MFLRYDELTAKVKGWAVEHPEFVDATSLGQTPGGREMWLLTIGRDPDRPRPAVWVDGNMHASELCGSAVALQIAEDMIALHSSPDATVHGLPRHVCDRLREILFYILPRMSPDGAEAVLETGRYVRSVPRDERLNRAHARWLTRDVDGDGLALLMRVEDPAGEFVECPELPGLMLPRRLEDPPPFYKIYPEGEIENFDGHAIPDPHYLSDNQTDLNRNFPYQWAPEHEEEGAGAHPMSEPESRAVVEFASAHPNLFAWLNLHTFGGVFIRPLGARPDSKMNPSDLALFRQIGDWATELTGYPMVSGYEEFTYEPEKPIFGDLTEYAYHQRGCISYVIELWDLFAQLGLPRQKRFVDHYTHMTRNDLIALGKWDREHNKGRVLRPWRRTEHPQLGSVEVGGLDPRIGIWNPPLEKLAEVQRAHSAAFLRVAALAPSLRAETTARQALGPDATRVEVTISNVGYLPTYVLASAKKLDIAEPLHVEAVADGCELVSEPRREIGHLEGWGRGLYDPSSALFHQRSRGSVSRRTIACVARGRGMLHLRIGSCRMGWIDHAVEI